MEDNRTTGMKNGLPMQLGDVPRTWANTEHLNALGYQRTTPIQEGVREFVEWFNHFNSK